jgi:hypothetical protein
MIATQTVSVSLVWFVVLVVLAVVALVWLILTRGRP